MISSLLSMNRYMFSSMSLSSKQDLLIILSNQDMEDTVEYINPLLPNVPYLIREYLREVSEKSAWNGLYIYKM